MDLNYFLMIKKDSLPYPFHHSQILNIGNKNVSIIIFFPRQPLKGNTPEANRGQHCNLALLLPMFYSFPLFQPLSILRLQGCWSPSQVSVLEAII